MIKEIYDHNDMKQWKKYFYYPVTLFRNVVINKIPSRHFRRFIDKLMGARIGQGSFMFRRTEVLFPKGVSIGDHTTIGWFTLLDARGGIKIGNNVCIASYVKIVTGSHDINDPRFKSIFKSVIIEDYAWVCTGATICQGVTIGTGAVIAAGAVVTDDVQPYTVVGGVPAKKIGERKKQELLYHPKTDILY